MKQTSISCGPLDQFRQEWMEIENNNRFVPAVMRYRNIELWYDLFAKPGTQFVVCVYNRFQPIGLFPFVRTLHKGFRVIRTATDIHHETTHPLIKNGWEKRFYELFFLYVNKLPSWDIMKIPHVYEFEYNTRILLDCLDCHRPESLIKSSKTFCVDTTGSFENYLKILGGTTRRGVRKCISRIEKRFSVEVETYTDQEAFRRIQHVFDQEKSGWKGEAKIALETLSPDVIRYNRAVIRTLGENGLYVFFLYMNGALTASLYGYAESEIFHGLRNGYDEKFHAVSPGKYLTFKMIEYFSSHPKIEMVHMYPYSFGYKNHLFPESHYRFFALCFNRTARGRAANFLYRMKRDSGS